MILIVHSSGIGPAHVLIGGDVRTYRYRIIVSGELGKTGREALADFRIEHCCTNAELIGELDQAALFGALNRIRALDLELVGLERISKRWT